MFGEPLSCRGRFPAATTCCRRWFGWLRFDANRRLERSQHAHHGDLGVRGRGSGRGGGGGDGATTSGPTHALRSDAWTHRTRGHTPTTTEANEISTSQPVPHTTHHTDARAGSEPGACARTHDTRVANPLSVIPAPDRHSVAQSQTNAHNSPSPLLSDY